METEELTYKASDSLTKPSDQPIDRHSMQGDQTIAVSFAQDESQGKAENDLPETIGAGHEQPEPADPDALNTRGIQLARNGDVAGALELFRRAIRLCPGFVQARQNLGVALGQLGDADGALVAFA
jgi:Flp pilus assembly protein TadD